MLESWNFVCMLTQCVRMTGKFFFEFEKKNLLIASKAPTHQTISIGDLACSNPN